MVSLSPSYTQHKDLELSKSALVDTNFSGTTVVLAALRGTKLLVASVGDSRALLVKRCDEEECKATGRLIEVEQLTTDHKASLPEEVCFHFFLIHILSTNDHHPVLVRPNHRIEWPHIHRSERTSSHLPLHSEDARVSNESVYWGHPSTRCGGVP